MKIEIVENIKEKMKIDNKYVNSIVKGIKIDKKRAEKKLIITAEGFAKIFSPERIKLILRIKSNNMKNIYQLAKELNRKYEAVYRDIKLLEGFGVIKLKEKDKKKIPFMESITIPQFAAA